MPDDDNDSTRTQITTLLHAGATEGEVAHIANARELRWNGERRDWKADNVRWFAEQAKPTTATPAPSTSVAQEAVQQSLVGARLGFAAAIGLAALWITKSVVFLIDPGIVANALGGPSILNIIALVVAAVVVYRRLDPAVVQGTLVMRGCKWAFIAYATLLAVAVLTMVRGNAYLNERLVGGRFDERVLAFTGTMAWAGLIGAAAFLTAWLFTRKESPDLN